MNKLILPVVLFMCSVAFAGQSTGNGGNSIVCQRGPKTEVELLDYYELRVKGGQLTLNSELGNFEDILTDLFNRWAAFAPARMAQYKKWLKEFKSDSGIYSGVEIPPIPDTGTISIPTGCELHPVAFQRPDNEVFPGEKRYIIRKDLWDLMSETQKAGLVLHELIYREGILAGHTTSFPTRYLNGYLSSATPNFNEYSAIISQMPLLWTEYAGAVIVKIGEMQGQLGCPQCLSFKRLSKISQDGKALNIQISQILGNIETENYAIRFDESVFKRGPLPYSFLFSFENDMMTIDTRSPPQSKRQIYILKEIEIKNRFRLVFPEPQYFGLIINLKPKSTQRFFNFLGNTGNFLLDPIKSWFRNTDGQLIEKIHMIDIDELNAEENWLWNRELGKYVK